MNPKRIDERTLGWSLLGHSRSGEKSCKVSIASKDFQKMKLSGLRASCWQGVSILVGELHYLYYAVFLTGMEQVMIFQFGYGATVQHRGHFLLCRWSHQTRCGCSCAKIQRETLRNCPFILLLLVQRDWLRSVCLSACLSVCLFVFQWACLSACLSFSEPVCHRKNQQIDSTFKWPYCNCILSV